jgi:hypothetical protein
MVHPSVAAACSVSVCELVTVLDVWAHRQNVAVIFPEHVCAGRGCVDKGCNLHNAAGYSNQQPACLIGHTASYGEHRQARNGKCNRACQRRLSFTLTALVGYGCHVAQCNPSLNTHRKVASNMLEPCMPYGRIYKRLHASQLTTACKRKLHVHTSDTEAQHTIHNASGAHTSMSSGHASPSVVSID